MMPGKSQEISLIPTYKEIFLFICLVLGLGQLSFSVVSSRGSNVLIAAFTCNTWLYHESFINSICQLKEIVLFFIVS